MGSSRSAVGLMREILFPKPERPKKDPTSKKRDHLNTLLYQLEKILNPIENNKGPEREFSEVERALKASLRTVDDLARIKFLDAYKCSSPVLRAYVDAIVTAKEEALRNKKDAGMCVIPSEQSGKELKENKPPREPRAPRVQTWEELREKEGRVWQATVTRFGDLIRSLDDALGASSFDQAKKFQIPDLERQIRAIFKSDEDVQRLLTLSCYQYADDKVKKRVSLLASKKVEKLYGRGRVGA